MKVGWEGEAPPEPEALSAARLGRSLTLPKTIQ